LDGVEKGMRAATERGGDGKRVEEVRRWYIEG
jgi:hypothetical protein